MADRPTTFKKGQSGNPGGRQQRRERLIIDMIAAQRSQDPAGADVDGWQALVNRIWTIAMTADPRDAVAALKVLLPYKFGNPKQEVEITDGEAQPIDWSKVPIERRRVLLAALAEVDALADDATTEH